MYGWWKWENDECLDGGEKKNDECVEDGSGKMLNREMVEIGR